MVQRLKIETKLEVHNGCVSILRNLNTCCFFCLFFIDVLFLNIFRIAPGLPNVTDITKGITQ